MAWTDVLRYATAAGGIIHLRDAVTLASTTPSSVTRRARADGWARPFPGVLAVPGVELTPALRVRAAILSYGSLDADADADVGPRVAATRDTALAVYGIQRSFPTQVQLAVDAARRLAARAGVQQILSRGLSEPQLVQRDGITVVRPATLLRQLAPVRGDDALREAAIALLAAREVELGEVAAELEHHTTFVGRPRLRAVLSELEAAGRTDSGLELRVRTELLAAGIPLDRGQVHVPGTRLHLDLGIAAIRFGIEVDSFAFHASPRALDRDAARRNLIARIAPEWAVLHVTWAMVTRGWPAFLGQVRDVVRAQSRRHLEVDGPA
jgi:hypothetical protein